ncbi:MAG: M50 family metallopeptidase [Promethearchaeota archaeon]|nr:MAG: M50 family metallopeptidase [Candidatus Lokiarchaeota archaeon]
MTICAHCGEEIIGDLFYCSDCRQNYCIFHKEPINHECNIVKESLRVQQLSTTPTYGEPSQISPAPQEHTYQQQIPPSVVRGTTDGTYTWYRQESQVPVNAFDPDSGIEFKGILLPHKSEFTHFLIGLSLIFIIGLLIFTPNLVNTGYEWAIFMLAGFYATAFLFHEFGHRQVAIHFGLQTKFRLLTFGMILTVTGVVFGLYSLISGGPSFPSLALPGAVVVLGLSKIDRTTGLCKAAGPTVNLAYGSILFIISFIIPTYPLNMLIGLAANLNFMLGTFNMIPVGILDGQNIWKWNKKVYLALCGSLLVLLIITYVFIYTPLY